MSMQEGLGLRALGVHTEAPARSGFPLRLPESIMRLLSFNDISHDSPLLSQFVWTSRLALTPYIPLKKTDLYRLIANIK